MFSQIGGQRALIYTARTLAFLWAGFWIFFGVASAIHYKTDLMGIFLYALQPGLIFLVITLLSVKWETAGSIFLIVIAFIVFIRYPLTFGKRFPLSTTLFIYLTMAIPPLISGTLLLVNKRKWIEKRS